MSIVFVYQSVTSGESEKYTKKVKLIDAWWIIGYLRVVQPWCVGVLANKMKFLA